MSAACSSAPISSPSPRRDGEWQQIKPAILGAIMEHFMSGAPLVASGRQAADAASRRVLRRQGCRHRRHHQGADRDARPPGGRQRRRRHHLPRLQGRHCLSAHEGRLLGLPVLHRDAASTASRTCCAISCPTWSKSGRCRSPSCPVKAGIRTPPRYWMAVTGSSAFADDRHRGVAYARSCHRYRAGGLLGRRARHRARGDAPRMNRCRWQRGHAEALMPLIARVLDARRARLRRSRPHRRHHRARQLHRLARRHCGRARHRARRRQAGDRPVDARGVRRAIDRRRRHAASRGGDRCAPRSRLPASVRAGRPHDRDAAARRRCAKRCACRRPAPRASLAPRRSCWRPPGRPASARRLRSTSAARPISTGWRGLAPPRPTPARRRSRFICARPTPSRKTPRNWRADDRLSSAVCSRAASRRCRRRRAAMPRAIARAACRLLPARLERTGSRGPADRPPRDRAPRHDRRHDLPASSCRAWSPTRRKSSRSRSRRAARARACARDLLDLHLRRLAGLGCAHGVSGSRRAQRPGASGSMSARDFTRCRAAPITIRAPAAKPPPRWCCGAILSNRRWTTRALNMI